jgi:hypothetical protein
VNPAQATLEHRYNRHSQRRYRDAADLKRWAKAMGFLHNLKLQFTPPRLVDPDFGNLRFMYISKHPERSYWECEWEFPKTKTKVFIPLPGDENGPTQKGRAFYLGLVDRYETLLLRLRPKLEEVFSKWLKQPLPADISEVVSLSGFDVEDFDAIPMQWSLSFETKGDKWLGIQIFFVGDEPLPQRATVDT